MLFQIFLVVFSILAMARTIRQYKARQVSRYWLSLMLVVWTAVGLVAILPRWTDIVAEAVGVGRGADLLVYVAIIVLLWSHYRLMIRQHVMSQELTALVRHQALQEGKADVVRRASGTPEVSSAPSKVEGMVEVRHKANEII